ncbi:MAG: 50S ribosomal protein L14e [Candidatus Aenigmarchaeota archaeon]|nr:50S ribosomal protein L14e [Candidatus Aenigmarchaeota archaeon]MBU5688771.1 50S ribosomal protein L14e [Candidatus Aenigmarchaeota archaeon]
MATLEVGRLCIKTAGREAGRYCVVLKTIDSNFVMITGPRALTGVKKRKCNIEHLEPTQYLLKIKEDASDKEVIEAYDKMGLISKLNLKKPSPEELKEEKTKKEPEEKEEKTTKSKTEKTTKSKEKKSK